MVVPPLMHEKEPQPANHSPTGHKFVTTMAGVYKYCMCVCRLCLDKDGPFCICDECACNGGTTDGEKVYGNA
jgi:hypothetical protein